MTPKTPLIEKVKNYLNCQSGAAAVEYGVIAMAMFLAIIPAFLYVSTGILVKLQSIAEYFGRFA